MKRFIMTVVAVAFVAACGPSKDEWEAKLEEIDDLKAQLDDLRAKDEARIAELEEKIDALPGEQVNLKHGDKPDDDFDADELAMGVEVEKEHTDDPDLAKQIAKAHLVEFSDYYTRLEKMEKEAEAE